MVANYVTDDELRASWYLWKDAFKLMSGRFKSAELFARLVNAGGDLVCTRYSMPLAEALDADSGGAICNFLSSICAIKILGSANAKVHNRIKD